jgi:hypothetical protein
MIDLFIRRQFPEALGLASRSGDKKQVHWFPYSRKESPGKINKAAATSL